MNKDKIHIEDLKKHRVFTTPENYFEDLPMRIQKRIEEKKSTWKSPFFIFSLKYAFPVLIILFVSYWGYIKYTSVPEYEAILDQLSTDDLIEYLAVTNITTNEILEFGDLESLFSEDIDNEEMIFDDLELDDQELLEIYQELGGSEIEDNI